MTTKKQKSLKDQLAESQAKSASLLKKIQEEEAKNKPKSIIDLTPNFAAILKIAKPTKGELTILNYKGKSKRLLLSRDLMAIGLISEVLNEGTELTLKDERYFPWYDVSSGFVFIVTDCAETSASASSASRLSLKSSPLATHAGKVFLAKYKRAIS